MKKIFQYIGYIFYRMFVFGFRITPFWLLYLESDVISFLIFRVFRYRVKVVDKNLAMCFPEKTKAERDEIKKKYYPYMVDLFMESLKGYTYPAEKIRKRLIYDDLSIPERLYAEGKSMIVAMGHHGNWEWTTQTVKYEHKHKFCAIFKPLNNPYISNFTVRCREQRGTHFCPIEKTRFAFGMREKQPTGFCMAGDQNSPNIKRSIWVDFFGIKTACLPGIENYAKLFDLPVIFMEIRREKRGYYRCYVSMIAEDPSKCEKGEITQKYMSKLEEVMRNQPETWLWSHKRWKTALQPDGTVTSSGFYDNL